MIFQKNNVLTLIILLIYTTSQSFQIDSAEKQRCRSAFRHIGGDGFGYKGYTTLESFFSPRQINILSNLPFVDLRGHVLNTGKFATNVGIGLRKQSKKRIYGINFYYDYRATRLFDYNQIGFGLEWLGSSWDFIFNSYIPLGKKITDIYDIKKYDFALQGLDLTLGYHFKTSKNFDFYAATGPYFYEQQRGPNFWGGKFSLACEFKEFFTIELTNSYDKIYGYRLQYEFTITIPFGGGPDYKTIENKNKFSSIMIQPVKRTEIVGTQTIDTRNNNS